MFAVGCAVDKIALFTQLHRIHLSYSQENVIVAESPVSLINEADSRYISEHAIRYHTFPKRFDAKTNWSWTIFRNSCNCLVDLD